MIASNCYCEIALCNDMQTLVFKHSAKHLTHTASKQATNEHSLYVDGAMDSCLAFFDCGGYYENLQQLESSIHYYYCYYCESIHFVKDGECTQGT
mmetsp:Transcript_12007/g.15660  ORF Transcript_12007/g.15660 Transcript_12007/m.15660 type:complete len:95 (-) Transcript_12007:348-632(-)